ncbi:MAG: enolase C-terminal domain-like protein [Minwuia sp.]|uniref:enolase C-terminal domain-like protein n=1 Tax=Minwuia sp. TaxID=2493630 RepID=UPI003A8AA01C
MKIRRISARPVSIPMNRPVITGGGAVEEAVFVLIDVGTDSEIVGRSYVFAVSPLLAKELVALIEGIGGRLTGEDIAPRALHEKMWKSLRLAGVEGFIGWAIAGLDMAHWDAFAKQAGMPLYRVLGGQSREIDAYNSNGLGLIGPEAAAKEAAELAKGFGAVKLRLGYADVEDDCEVIEAVMDAVPPEMPVMCDYNQCLTRSDAKVRMAAIDDMGLAWIEEPLAHDDVDGYASLCAYTETPVQLGENARSPAEIARLIAAEAADLLMPDVAKIGGVTPWMNAADQCAASHVRLSTHLFPEISAHMMAASPTAHWLEYVDWAEAVLAEPLKVEKGKTRPSETPGAGIDWNEDAIAKFAI